MIQDRDITANKSSTDCEYELRPWTASKDIIPDASTPISHCITNANYTCDLFMMMAEFLDEM